LYSFAGAVKTTQHHPNIAVFRTMANTLIFKNREEYGFLPGV